MFNRIALTLFLSFSALAAGQEIDPTKPLNLSPVYQQARAKTKFVLQSVLGSDQGLKAVINGKVLLPGDSIAGYRLTQLSASSAELTSTEQSITLSLFTGAVIK